MEELKGLLSEVTASILLLLIIVGLLWVKRKLLAYGSRKKKD